MVGSAPTLINSIEVSELTASKITAGTIGAHEIVLTQPGTQTVYTPPGGMAVLRSSNYSAGSAGWLVRGDGLAEFNDLTVRSRLDIGGDDASSFHVDNDGNMWLGSGISNFNTAPFSVTNTGTFIATAATVTGAINATSGTINNTLTIGTNATKINIVGTATAATTAIYSGSSTYGSGGFWIDASGRFSLGNKLTWNGSGTLSIDGTVTIGGTTASTVVSNAAEGASALQPGEAATDVNNNVTNISGSKIRTGTIDSTNFSWDGATIYSVDGTRLDLVNGQIISKKFRIDSAGNATFGGTLSGASGSIGASLSIGDNVRVNGATGDAGATVFKVRGNSSSSTTRWIAKFQNNAPDDILSIRDDGLVSMNGTLNLAGNSSFKSSQTDGTIMFESLNNNDNRAFSTRADGNVSASQFPAGTGSTVVRSGGFLYYISSTIKIKENIEYIEDSVLSFIKKLKPVRYNLKRNSYDNDYTYALKQLNKEIGFIVEDIESIQDEIGGSLIDYDSQNAGKFDSRTDAPPFSSDEDFEDIEPRMYKTNAILSIAIKAIQELSAKVDELESRLV